MPPLATKIPGSNNHFSLVSLNINGFDSPIKRHRLTEWIYKQDPAFCCIQKTHLKRQTLPQSKGLEKNFPSKWSQETCWSSHTIIE